MRFIQEHWRYLTETGKYPGIDILRAIAICVVVFFHFNFPFFRTGHLGVDLFFVISGFLIGGMIWDAIDKNNFTFKHFYKNRFLRILPIYYLMIVLTILANRYIFHPESFAVTSENSIKSIFLTIFFLQTTVPYYFDVPFVHTVSPSGTWSLAVEEIFYLIAPILLVFLRKIFSKQKTVLILILLFLTGPITRLIATSDFHPDDGNWHFASYIQFHSRYDELLAGIIAAILVRMNVKNIIIPYLSIAAIGFCITYLVSHPVLHQAPQNMTSSTIWMPTVASLGFAGISISIANINYKNQIITFIARLSYPLYLVHLLLLKLFGSIFINNPEYLKFFGSPHAANYLLLFISLFVAYFLSLLIEYPFIKLYKNPKNKQFENHSSSSLKLA